VLLQDERENLLVTGGLSLRSSQAHPRFQPLHTSGTCTGSLMLGGPLAHGLLPLFPHFCFFGGTCLAIVVDLEAKVSILLSKGHADFMAGTGNVVLIDFALLCLLPTRGLGSPLAWPTSFLAPAPPFPPATPDAEGWGAGRNTQWHKRKRKYTPCTFSTCS